MKNKKATSISTRFQWDKKNTSSGVEPCSDALSEWNSQARGEDAGGGGEEAARLVFQRCDVQLKAVIEKPCTAVQENSQAAEDQSWRTRRDAASVQSFGHCVSKDYHRGGGEEEREEDSQGEWLPDKSCIQVDVLLLSNKNRPMGFAPHGTLLML